MPGLMKTPRQKIGKATPDFPSALPLESQVLSVRMEDGVAGAESSAWPAVTVVLL